MDESVAPLTAFEKKAKDTAEKLGLGIKFTGNDRFELDTLDKEKVQEFYKEETELAKDTALSIYSIRKAKKILEENGILKITKKGLPARHYFYIIKNGIEV